MDTQDRSSSPMPSGSTGVTGSAPQSVTLPAPRTPKPYYSHELQAERAARMLGQLHAVLVPSRGRTDAKVYKVDGGGEALVTSRPGGMLQIELFKGKCPC